MLVLIYMRRYNEDGLDPESLKGLVSKPKYCSQLLVHMGMNRKTHETLSAPNLGSCQWVLPQQWHLCVWSQILSFQLPDSPHHCCVLFSRTLYQPSFTGSLCPGLLVVQAVDFFLKTLYHYFPFLPQPLPNLCLSLSTFLLGSDG